MHVSLMTELSALLMDGLVPCGGGAGRSQLAQIDEACAQSLQIRTPPRS